MSQQKGKERKGTQQKEEKKIDWQKRNERIVIQWKGKGVRSKESKG